MKLIFDNIKTNEFNRALIDANFKTSLVETDGTTTTIEFPNETDEVDLTTRINSKIDINSYKLIKVITLEEQNRADIDYLIIMTGL